MVIYEECKKRKNNLSSAWIGYQKAHDGIPHSWVEKPIKIVKVHRKLSDCAYHQQRNGIKGFS